MNYLFSDKKEISVSRTHLFAHQKLDKMYLFFSTMKFKSAFRISSTTLFAIETPEIGFGNGPIISTFFIWAKELDF